MRSTVMEVTGLVLALGGAFLAWGVGGSLVVLGLILLVVGYMVGEP